MNKILLLLACIICLSFAANAKEITAVVKDKASGQAIAYANVGLAGLNIGTVTDESGKFSLSLPDSVNPASKLTVSMIGYKSAQFPLEELVKEKELFLSETVNTLSEVVVSSGKFKYKTLGNTTKSKSVTLGFQNDGSGVEDALGYEIGTLMKIKKKPTYIDSILINFSVCTYDSIFLRLNIYEADKGEFSNILQEPYYLSLSKQQVLDGVKLGLKEMNLVVSGNFLVTLELVRELGKGQLFYSAGFLGSKTYLRATSQGTWQTVPMQVGIGISAKVKY